MRIDWNWWNASVFCRIPILSVITVFFLKRKLLWIAPLISTVLSIAISVMMTSTSLLTYKEHRAMFFWNSNSYSACNSYYPNCRCIFNCIYSKKNKK